MRNLTKALCILACLFGCAILGQAQAGTLRGKVTDQTGAVIPHATVTATASSGKQSIATTDGNGSFEVTNIAPGPYSITVTAKGFAPFRKESVAVAVDKPQTLDVALEIQTQEEKVEVEAQGNNLDVSSSGSSAGSLIIKGKDLEALSDDPDELQSELQALAGPAAGPNGGQIYIDGFTGGQLPPKSSIREIRVNQNPFSAQYDKLGYGRIEIFTKPGSDKFHGQVSVEGNSSGLNTRNPFLGSASQQPYDSVIYMGNVGGPINKKASFFFNLQRRNIDEIAVVNAPGLGLSESVPNP